MPIQPPPPPPGAVTATPISAIAPSVLSRVQDPSAIFWNLNLEVYSALVEAINDLMLIVGRPTLTYATQITLNTNSVWQPMPPSMLAITNIRSSNYALWKCSLRDMDYTQASWRSDWELDVADTPQRWGPVGLNTFFIHPAVSQPVNVQIAGVAYPNNAPFPFTGAETSPFHTEGVEQALALYSEAYLRVKCIGDDATEGDMLYQQYLDIAKRLTNIEDRRDSEIFSTSFGVSSAVSRVTRR
jgi:hypothetical protein